MSRFLPLLLLIALTTRADDYPQWLGPHRDNVYRETGILTSLPPAGLKTLWRAPVAGGYSQAAVAGNKVIVTDRVPTPLPAGQPSKRPRPGVERIVCLEDATGQQLWKVEYDCPGTIDYGAGPRTTPAIDDGKVYTLGAEGHVYCIDINTGQILWNKKLEGNPTTWGYAASPLVEGDLLILLSSGHPLLTAFHKLTGQVAWTALEAKDPGYSPPTPMILNGQRQIIQYHPTGVASVDPKDGKVLWQLPYGPEQNGVTIVTPVQRSPDTFLLASAWNGVAAVQVSRDNHPKLLYHTTSKGREIKSLHPIHSQVVLDDGQLYGVHNTGHLVCLDPATGQALWNDPKPLLGDQEKIQWGTGFLTPHQPDSTKPATQYFLAADSGDLILCHLSKTGYRELGRTHLLDPTNKDPGRPALWSHPAYAHQSLYWRNDKELVRVTLSATPP